MALGGSPSGELIGLPFGNFGSSSVFRFDRERLAEFIRGQNEQGELTHWTIATASILSPKRTCLLGGHTVGIVERAAETLTERLFS